MNNVVNESQLLAHYEGDIELILELLQVFEETYSETLDELEGMYKANDFEKFEACAHTLKGMVSNFFAITIQEKASELEQMASEHSLAGAEVLIDEIKNLIPLMLTSIKDLSAPGENYV